MNETTRVLVFVLIAACYLAVGIFVIVASLRAIIDALS